MQGRGFVVPTPLFEPASVAPTRVEGGGILGYDDPGATPLPAGITNPEAAKNPNVLLTDALAAGEARGERVLSSVVIDVATGPNADGAGISNVAFLQPGGPGATSPANNAAVVRVSSVFWVERLALQGGAHALQLQYSQTVVLNFGGINWPHVSVATLRKVTQSGAPQSTA